MIIPKTYELIKTEEIPEIHATAYRLHHIKSGARLLLLETEDENKVFSITFRTTPTDSTGVPHIMEHSVLCGSEKYPLKDPFIELVKGSLNTFLNAMTWPDKTMYPVASCNDADFKNLMSVYMDAVLHPNIYHTENIFRQEGWHYELPDKDSPISYNGVVYNEMRGAFSDPDTVMEHEITKGLYEGSTYAVISGGDPDHIPDLTYEDFIAFHKRYYHPSNSYIYLYGNMDFTERLEWLSDAYLSSYDAIDPKSEITFSSEMPTPKNRHAYYNISEGEKEKSIFSYAASVGNLTDPIRSLAFQVISYALLNAPGAPLKKALLDAGIGADIYGGYDSSYKKPIFSVIAKDTDKKDYDRFQTIVKDVLQKTIREGIPKRTLLAGINNIEFSMREADSGSIPRGLVYGMEIAETWLHDEETALVHMHYDESFATLKKLAESDYFEKVIEESLLNNPHVVTVLLEGKEKYTDEKDQKIASRLASLKESLSDSEKEELIRKTRELKDYQAEKDTEEAMQTIPLLTLEDISEEPQKVSNIEDTVFGYPLLVHSYDTNGIGYLDIRFSLESVDISDFPYVGLLKNLYTLLDTKKHTYRELSDEISLLTGGIAASTSLLSKEGHKDCDVEHFSITARYLKDHTKDTVELVREIFTETVFTDTKRILEVIREMKAGLSESLISSGHMTARRRVLSYVDKKEYANDLLGGISFYRFLENLTEHFEEEKGALVSKLTELSEKIFTSSSVLISFTGREELASLLKGALPSYLSVLPKKEFAKGNRDIKPFPENEGFKTSSMVQYVAMGGCFTKYGDMYTGAFSVLATLLRYEYLWLNLRVQGGAYGCSFSATQNGEVAFTSYRDPHLKNTIAVYKKIPEYLNTLTISDRELLKYIIGTIGDVDIPVQPNTRGSRDLDRYLLGITDSERKKTRQQILHCTIEDLRSLASILSKVLEENHIAVIGSEAKIEADKDALKTITTLKG